MVFIEEAFDIVIENYVGHKQQKRYVLTTKHIAYRYYCVTSIPFPEYLKFYYMVFNVGRDATKIFLLNLDLLDCDIYYDDIYVWPCFDLFDKIKIHICVTMANIFGKLFTALSLYLWTTLDKRLNYKNILHTTSIDIFFVMYLNPYDRLRVHQWLYSVTTSLIYTLYGYPLFDQDLKPLGSKQQRAQRLTCTSHLWYNIDYFTW